LNRCPDHLTGFTASPSADGAVKPVTLPTRRILAGGMGGKLHCGGKSFSDLVCGHEQALTI
jgi:hypothetical protein